jgi:hypothetical protein
MGTLNQDCSGHSYSRIQYNLYDERPETGDPFEDFGAYYMEIDMMFENLEVIDPGQWASLLENYDGGATHNGWKSTLLLAHTTGELSFYMKNYLISDGFSQNQMNRISPESTVPFRLRIWYRASTTDGLWRATYTCPACSPPVAETTIMEWSGVATIDEEGTTPFAVAPKVAGMWDDLTFYWLSFTMARPAS